MTSLKSIIRADYLQRTRSYAFLVTLLASIVIAYTFVPTPASNYSTLRIGNYVGQSNAAWIGHNTAIMASVFLWLIGFYLVNDGIKKDKETGVGQIIATTSISNFKYLIAKALSNFFVLLTIAIIIILMSFSLVMIRGSGYPFNLLQFILPYLFITFPSIFCVSALAVFAEILLGKYVIIQNVAFFFLFPVLIGILSLNNNPQIFWFDVLGTKYVSDELISLVNHQFNENVNEISAGYLFGNQKSIKYFLFEGTNWSILYIVSRFMWIGIAFILLFISAKIFNRFDLKEKLVIKKKHTKKFELEIPLNVKQIHLSQLPVAAPAFGIWPFVITELLMLFRIGPKWFWLINIGGFIALFFIPINTAHQIVLPVLWFLQTNRWADIATKEKINRTHYFTYASYQPLRRLLTAQIIAGVILSVSLAFPLIFRYALNGNFQSMFNIMQGAIFIIALSVFTGILSGGKRFFEIVFFMLTYCNISLIPILDYFGGINHGSAYALIILFINVILMVGAFLYRKHEISNQ
jgi:hypothetical protein